MVSKQKPRMHDLLLRRIDKLRRPGYTSQYNLVLREIADRYNMKDGYAWPSAANIAQRTWISVGQVRRIIGS
jgi:hypothetical protein